MRTASRPGIDARIWTCTSSGSEVEMPFGYTVVSSSPSGSKKIWCPSRSPKRTILSSIEGQYRGPLVLICPDYIGERCTLARMISWVAGVVRVLPHGIDGVVVGSVIPDGGS